MSSGFPLNPINNQTYTVPGTSLVYVYNTLKDAWKLQTSSVTNVTTSNLLYSGTTPPSDTSYSFWYDGSDGTLYFYDRINNVWLTSYGSTVGPQGIQGPVGPIGPQGVQGIQGNPGTGLTNKGNWTSGTTYNPGDYVFYTVSNVSSLYVLIGTAYTSSSAPNNDPSHWSVLTAPQGSIGLTGATGPSRLSALTVWATNTTYTVGPPASYVSINGSSYVCLTNHTSSTFSSDLASNRWGTVASVGNTGAAGVQGVKGDTGATGPQGIQGPTGATGVQGPAGPQGAQGIQGPIGPTDLSAINSLSSPLARTTPEAYGATTNSDASNALSSAFQSGKTVDFYPKSYNLTSTNTFDFTKTGLIPSQADFTSSIGSCLVRNRNGNPIGLAFNHRLEHTQTASTGPTTQAGTKIITGNLIAPPLSTALPLSPIDIIAQWYGDWGLDWYRQQTGIGSSNSDPRTFYNWYDGAWNWPTNLSPTSNYGVYDKSRMSILGNYFNDDPNTLDWQAYWLREAGVKAIVPCAFNLNISTWANASDRNLWIFRLLNTPNGKNLSYIPWGRSTEFTDPDGPVIATQSDITSQWSTMWFSLARAYTNNYVTVYQNKRYFTLYVWNMERLRAIFDTSGSANFAAWLKLRADEVRSEGYDGLAIFAHTAVANSTMDRTALLGNNVLHMQMAYGGPVDSTIPANGTYTDYVNNYAPPASGEILSVSTSLKSVVPINTFNISGSSPALFTKLMAKATKWLCAHTSLLPMLNIYNVSEWCEGGSGLHPDQLNGWGYLDGIRQGYISK